MQIPYSLNILRIKNFTDFAVLSETVKIVTLNYLSKHAISLRNVLSPQKFNPEIRKCGSKAKIFTLEIFRLYGIKYIIQSDLGKL